MISLNSIVGTIISPKELNGTLFYLNGINERFHVAFNYVGQILCGLRNTEKGCTFRYANEDDLKRNIPYIGDLATDVKDKLNGVYKHTKTKVYPRPYLCQNVHTLEIRSYNTVREPEKDGFSFSSVHRAAGDKIVSIDGWVWVRKNLDETEESLRERLNIKLEGLRKVLPDPIYYIGIESGVIAHVKSTRELEALGFRTRNVQRAIAGGAHQHVGYIFVQEKTEEESRALLVEKLKTYKDRHKK